MALVARNALKGGRRAAVFTALGVVSGLFVWTGASAVGVSVVLEANAFAFTVLKLAGAAYLMYLGGRALISNWKHGVSEVRIPENRLAFARVNSPYAQGLLNNLFNPKIAVFFTSLIPAFITPGSSVPFDSAELAFIFAVMGLVWLMGFSIFAGTARNLLRLPRVKAGLETATGLVLVGLGLKVAMETR
jgi:threonine/homoserine/homoserine lactone efflux protein